MFGKGVRGRVVDLRSSTLLSKSLCGHCCLVVVLEVVLLVLTCCCRYIWLTTVFTQCHNCHSCHNCFVNSVRCCCLPDETHPNPNQPKTTRHAGIIVDFETHETVTVADNEAYAQFLSDLVEAFHPAGMTVSVCVSPGKPYLDDVKSMAASNVDKVRRAYLPYQNPTIIPLWVIF